MNAKQMLQMGGYPDTDEGRAAFYSDYPTKESFMMRHGGQLSGAPHNGQPTEQQFFSWGQPINGPRAFYQSGGQPTAAEFFAWGEPIMGPQGFYQEGGSNSPLGYGAFPTMQNGGTNTQDIDSATGQKKKSFMDYIQENVQKDAMKKEAQAMEQMMLEQYMMQGMMRNGGTYYQSGGAVEEAYQKALLEANSLDPNMYSQRYIDSQKSNPLNLIQWMPEAMYNPNYLSSHPELAKNPMKTLWTGDSKTWEQAPQKSTGSWIPSSNNSTKGPQAQPPINTGLRYGGNLPKAQQMGQYNEDGSFKSKYPMTPGYENTMGIAGNLPSYNTANEPTQGNAIDMNNIQMQGNNQMSIDPLNQTNALGSIDFSKADVSASAFPHTAYQGPDQPPYENGKTQYMLEPEVNTGNQMGMDWRNPQQEPSYTGNAAYNYNPIMMDENQTKGMPISSEAEITPGMKGELQPGRGKKNNPLLPYALLTGVRGATWLASADERRAQEDAQQKYMDPNYWAMSRRPGDRGNWDKNNSAGVAFRPNATGATVDPWGNANMKGQMGNPYYTAAYGGEQEGGQVEEMTDAQIQQFLEMGGQLEILD